MEVLSCSLSSSLTAWLRFEDWLMICVSAFNQRAICLAIHHRSYLSVYAKAANLQCVWHKVDLKDGLFEYEEEIRSKTWTKTRKITRRRRRRRKKIYCVRTQANAEIRAQQKSLLNTISILFYSILIVSSDLRNMKALCRWRAKQATI